jgi:hypothetical protein
MDAYINSNNPNIILMAAWFTSANTCEEALLKDISFLKMRLLNWFLNSNRLICLPRLP